MDRMKSICFSCVLFAFLLLPLCVSANDVAVPQPRFEHTYTMSDFRANRDAVKYEIPENGIYKIVPRTKNTGLWTHFLLPDAARNYAEWAVTANVRASEGPAVGVGLWNGDDGYALFVFPDGNGFFNCYEKKKPVWTDAFVVANLAFPARVTIERDANGSMMARINGTVVSARLLDVDYKKPKATGVTSVSFATHSQKTVAGYPALYESLYVQGWGAREAQSLFQ